MNSDSILECAQTGKTKGSSLRAFRSWLIFAHKTIGLTFGVIFMLIGLSGAILVYRDAIDESLNAGLMRVEPEMGGQYRPIDDIFDAAKAAMPPDAKPERITLPRHAWAAATVTYLSETDDLDTFAYDMFVDPYTAKVKGQRLKIHGDDRFSQPAIALLMDFHWTLLLGANNAFLIGGVAIVVFISILIGFYLWWPVNGNWRLGLKIKWPATTQRIIYDLHRATGFYFGLILLISLFTGVAMIFKPVTRDLVSLVSPVRGKEDFGKSQSSGGQAPISPGAAVRIADTVFPQGRLHWILLPTSPTGVYVVGKQSTSEPNRSKTFHNVGIDQYSGAVTRIQDRDAYRFGDKFMEWLFPLHSGEFLGEIGRPLFVLLGLSPLLLFTTGVLRWSSKRRALKT
jgi:uncharacterized iron-regulated membrane protein